MKKRVYRLCADVVCVVMLFGFASVFAFAEGPAERAEMVFVLDASNSMNENDPEHLAADAINQMLHSMLSNVDVGFVAFNDKVTEAAALTGHDGRERLSERVSAVAYTGYTDAGSALEAAVGLFSAGQGIPRYIVILSDGEIAARTADETARSLQRFSGSIADAKAKGITIFTIGLEDEAADISHSIFDAARESGGKTYYAPTADDLQTAINTILWTDLGFRKSSVASVTASGAEDRITVKLPVAGADTVRVLLSSDAAVGGLGVRCNSEGMRIHTGKKFGIVELEKPAARELEVCFTGSAGQRVSAELVTEYRAAANASVSYADDVDYERVLRTATVSLTLQSPGGQNENILADPYFEGREILLGIDGDTRESRKVKIQNGTACFTRPVGAAETLRVTASLPGLALNLFPMEPAVVELEAPPPPPPPPPDYRPLWITMGVLAMAAAGIIVFILNRRVKTRKRLRELQPPKSIYSFAGKLNIYVTHTPSDSDIAPQTYRLYRQFSRRELSLAAILEECGVKLELRGAAAVLFRPGANHSLVVTNKSDCTLLKGRDLVMKEHSNPMYFEEKLTVTFEDELSELTMIYKNVKPSDR